MTQPQLNRRLTSMDSSFLYFEKKEATMHIGSVSIFEGEIPFDKFIANINSKMHLLPRYQQKVIPDPFNLGHPTWEFDQNFDTKNHVFRMQIDAPGSEKELIELAGRIFTAISRVQVNIIAIAQGSSELTIAVVVRRDGLEQAVKSVHAECGLGRQTAARGQGPGAGGRGPGGFSI